MKTKYALFLKLIGSLFALALLAAPSLGAPQVTITQVDVVVGGQHFDDTAAPGNPLSQFNDEPITSPPLFAFNESLTWVSAFTGSTFTLQLGYADNEHGNPCPAAGCFPQPVWGTAAANVFIGAGLAPP